MSYEFSKRGLWLLTLACLAFGGSQAVLAFQGMHQNEMYEIKLPEFTPVPASAPDLRASSQQISETLSARYDGIWKVHSHNTRAGTPEFVYGSGADLAVHITSPVALEQLSRQVLADNQDILHADPANLQLADTPHALGKWVAHFQQTYEGLEVWQGKARVAFSDNGRLLVMGSDYYRDIDLDAAPTLTQGEAIQIAVDDLPYNAATDEIQEKVDLLVLPYPLSATAVEHHLVYRVRVRTADPLGIWVTHIDAHDGEIIWRYNDIHFDYLGTTTSDVQEDTYCNGVTVQAMPYLRLTINGIGTVNTDSDGNWTTPGTGGSRSVTADLYGPYVDLNNYTGPEAAYSGSADEDVSHTVQFNNLNSQQDERDTFDAVNDIHDFFQLFAPEFSYANQRINAYVSRTDGYCPGNAWWDGTINFCSAGSGYANTGEIQGVVHHEFGHGVQDAIIGYQGDQGLGEGNSDILATYLTQDPAMGRGFYQDDCSGGIRNADNNLTYPGDVIGQPIHYAGQVICGFNWDSMLPLQDLYGFDQGTIVAATNWHYGRVLMQPTTQPAQVFATFFADDDDDNLDNGTPHHAIYCEAATNHGFECPAILVGVLFSHTPLNDTTDTVNPYVVQTTVFSTEAALDPASIKTVWRLDGGAWQEIVMTDLGGDLYEAPIEAQAGGKIDYYLTAEDVIGTTGTLPAAAPDDFFDFLVALSIDPVEVTGDWTAGDPTDDATSGQWERVDPIGTFYGGSNIQPEDDHTIDGTDCWITGQHTPGESAGFNDVDGGKTTLYSPVFDLSSYEEVTIRYWKYFTQDRGINPGDDYWDVFISNNGGTDWIALEHTMDSTNAWVHFTFNLLDYFPSAGQVQLQFVAADEGQNSLLEAGIDDLVIMAVSSLSPVSDDDGVAVRLATDLGQNAPNPFNPITQIDFSLRQNGPVTLSIFDVKGRLVRTLMQGVQEAGAYSVMWDGTATSGRSVASGVYFYRLQTQDETLSKRMLLVK